MIADSIEEKDRAKGFGIIGACFGIGFIAGPAIAALTVGISIKLPFIIAGCISFLAVLLTIFLLDETNRNIGKTSRQKMFDWKKLAGAVFDQNTGKTLLISLLWSFAFGMYIYAFQPFSAKALHLSERNVSLIFVLFGVIGLISQIVLIGRINKALGPLKAFSAALGVLAVSFILFFFSQNIIHLIVASIIMGIANSTVQTMIQTILSQETTPERQGEIMGLNASYMSIGQILGPIAGGSIALLAIYYPFLAGSIIIFIAFLVARNIRINSTPAKIN